MSELQTDQIPRVRSKNRIEHRQAKSILSRASGFIDQFDFTLNPYSGCTFACTYCYAASFASTDELKAQWGHWVHIKDNALQLLINYRRKPLIDKTIYMSSVTDPYQPVERELELTRSLVAELAEYHDVKLVVQTRSPLVTRDLDLLKRFKRVRVNMTITTDDEAIRRAFEPTCPSVTQRLNAIAEVAAAGIETCITLTPLLPVRDPQAFGERLRETGVQHFVVQEFHTGKQRFAASTGDNAWALSAQLAWTPARYREVVSVLHSYLPGLREGREGFVPSW
ncbi:MAG: radical SAM protein [Chloroflexota bacterium]